MLIKINKRIRTNYVTILLSFLLLFMQQIALSQNSQNKTENLKKSSQSINNYRLNRPTFHPGDGLYISTLPDTTSFFNRVLSIDDMGFVDFPVIGRVSVSNMTEEELTSFIKQNFEQYLRTPNVYVKPMLRTSVLGGVARPGLYYVDYHSSLWDVFRIAGGTTMEYGLKEMVWERDRDEVVSDLIPFFEKGTSLKNMGFKSGDQLWTPTPGETFWDKIRTDVIPILSFATTIIMFYFTYQTQIAIATYRR